MSVKYISIFILSLFTRFFPLRTKTGLRKIGNPDEKSPVFLTCSYIWTVIKVKKHLKSIDCYLLVANSRGINVWCGAAGGAFTSHDIISALKTSGIENLVKKRKVILPQLAATGIEPREIKKKTGWQCVWGPVHSKDIKAFMQNGLQKTEDMRTVKFKLPARIEMALIYIMPLTIICYFLTLLIWKGGILAVISILWLSSLLLYISFPIYKNRLKQNNPNEQKADRFALKINLFRLVVSTFILIMIVVSLYGIDRLSTNNLISWGITGMLISFVLTIDLLGSTPVLKSGTHEDCLFTVTLDKIKCRGTGICIDVCPRNCFYLKDKKTKVSIVNPGDCIRCGACIVQCPFDALFFKSSENKIIKPDTIRKYKLNLAGKRSVSI
jgi:NAD-dependent dihydropyrimidine dehydrogenase PreA subunit